MFEYFINRMHFLNLVYLIQRDVVSMAMSGCISSLFMVLHFSLSKLCLHALMPKFIRTTDKINVALTVGLMVGSNIFYLNKSTFRSYYLATVLRFTISVSRYKALSFGQ